MIIIIALIFLFASFALGQITAYDNAGKFVCESHGLKYIKSESSGLYGLTKVECGNKKPELQYDNYKVFTKWSLKLKLTKKIWKKQ